MNFNKMLLFRRYKMMYRMIIINNHSYKIIIGKITKKNNIIIHYFISYHIKYIKLYINFNTQYSNHFTKILIINNNLLIILRTSI